MYTTFLVYTYKFNLYAAQSHVLPPFSTFCVYANGIHNVYILEVHFVLDVSEIAS